MYTVKKGYGHSSPQPGYHLPNSFWAVIIKFFPPIENLVTGMSLTFFYGVCMKKSFFNYDFFHCFSNFNSAYGYSVPLLLGIFSGVLPLETLLYSDYMGKKEGPKAAAIQV
jgi:hypothetical protein